MGTYEIRISQDEPVYIISVVSRLVGIPVWTLRQLDKSGIVSPKRVGSKNRLYSMKDIKRLEYVFYLMREKNVNIGGLKMILEMQDNE
jgi:MerR family transcriptional regulator/heat shock protein HspR